MSSYQRQIIARLKPDWHIDATGCNLVRNGKSFRPIDLPGDVRIEATCPETSGGNPPESPDDVDASHIRFIFPPRSRLKHHLDLIRSWDSVDEARIG